MILGVTADAQQISAGATTYGLDFALSESANVELTIGTNLFTINVSVISVNDDTDAYIIGNYVGTSVNGHIALRTASSTELSFRVYDGVSMKETADFTYSSGDKITIERTSTTNIDVTINDSGTPTASLTVDSGLDIQNTYISLGSYITTITTTGLETDLWDVTIGAGDKETFLPTSSSSAPITGSEGTSVAITGSPVFFEI